MHDYSTYQDWDRNTIDCKLEEQQTSSSVFCGLLCLISNSILI